MAGAKKIDYKFILSVLGFSLTPILSCLLLCLRTCHTLDLTNIFIANSTWNDEIFYYKMIEGMAKYNMPLGYFGYNGSTANIGTLGPWNFVIMLMHVVYAKIFGWSLLSPIYCNILLMTISMVIFAILVRPSLSQALFICLLYCSHTFMTRYVLSGMMETPVYALTIIFLGISIKMYRNLYDVKIRYVVIMNVILFLLFQMRPYFLILMVLPGYFLYKKHHKKSVVLLEIAWVLFSCGMAVFISRNFCSAYTESMIKLSWLKILFDSPIYGVYNIIIIFVSAIQQIWESFWETNIYGLPMGGIYFIYFIAIAYFLCVILLNKDNKERRRWLSWWLFYFCVMLLAIIYLANIGNGVRYSAAFILIFIFIFSLEVKSVKGYILALAAFVWAFGIKEADSCIYSLPMYTYEKEAMLEKGRNDMMKVDFCDLAADTPWDNTIIWPITVDYTYLYAIPEGAGIELYTKEINMEDFAGLQSKYILTSIGSEIDLLCEQGGKEMITEYGNAHIWKLRE
ncbi:MAG: hypothetical protein NC313_06755 [Butyrivibrio sp.]|nr:hypothetical protein [Butyrivibrio sp.]